MASQGSHALVPLMAWPVVRVPSAKWRWHRFYWGQRYFAEGTRISLLGEFAFICLRESRAASTFCWTQLVGGWNRDQAACTPTRAAPLMVESVGAGPRVVAL